MIVFRYARGTALQLMLAGGAIVLAFALPLVRNGHMTLGSLFMPLVLIGLAGFAFRGRFDRRPQVILSERGIWVSHWNRKDSLLWSQVLQVRKIQVHSGEPMIVLSVTPETKLEGGKALTDLSFAFRTTQLDVRNNDAFARINEFWQRSKKAT